MEIFFGSTTRWCSVSMKKHSTREETPPDWCTRHFSAFTRTGVPCFSKTMRRLPGGSPKLCQMFLEAQKGVLLQYVLHT